MSSSARRGGQSAEGAGESPIVDGSEPPSPESESRHGVGGILSGRFAETNKRGTPMNLIDCLAKDQAQSKLQMKRSFWLKLKQSWRKKWQQAK